MRLVDPEPFGRRAATCEDESMSATDVNPLCALAPQPDDVGWPTLVWPVAEPTTEDGVDVTALDAAVATLFSKEAAPRIGTTQALVVAHRGRVVAERYAPGTAATGRLISWSTAKSMLHAAVGILVRDGRLDLDAPAEVPEWSDDDDPRRAITLRHLLEFRAGLAWSEDYVDDQVPDVIAMLFGDGLDDTAAYAAAKPLVHEPGTAFCYSSGTSNIISRIVRDVVAADRGIDPAAEPDHAAAATEAFLRRELFDPIGMRSVELRFDGAGTFIASSYCFATARDFARFAHLYLRDGVWQGRRLLPEGWVDQARTPRSTDEDGNGHGAHWWLWDENPWGIFSAWGYEGQYLVVVPALDLVVVRMGRTEAARRPALRRQLSALVSSFDH
jgi:CubicO group peptidase (beta-lactamase class C family)